MESDSGFKFKFLKINFDLLTNDQITWKQNYFRLLCIKANIVLLINGS